MTAPVFDRACQQGTADRVGQLNRMGRYGVAEGTSLFFIPSIRSDDRSCTGHMRKLRYYCVHWV
jgi:hypothetical protein